jgi:hypothetical protein
MGALIRRIDPLSRAAFGGLCIGGMTLEAIPVLVIVGIVGGIGIAVQGNLDRALAVWLGSWAAAVFATLLFLGIAYVFWPLASDWITEWQGYAWGFIIGGIGLAFMALTVFFTDWPLALEIIVPLVTTFAVGFLLPGRLIGVRRRPPAIETERSSRRRKTTLLRR